MPRVPLLLGILVLLAAGGVALGDGCVVRRSYSYSYPVSYAYPTYSYAVPTYQAPAHCEAAVATTYVPVYVPTYTVGYGSTQDAQTMTALVQAVQQLQQQVRALSPGVQAGAVHGQGFGQAQPGMSKAAEPIQPPAPAAPQAALSEVQQEGRTLLVQKCAACHDTSAAQAKGKGLAFVQNGQLGKLSDALAFRMMRELYSGRMPKDAKLTDEQVGKVYAYLDTLGK